jgi:hypothetical protein
MSFPLVFERVADRWLMLCSLASGCDALAELPELPELAELAKLPESAGIIAKQYGRRMSPTRHLSIRLDYGDGLRLGVLRPRSCA